MKRCPYCGNSNYDEATECRKCQASFVAKPEVVYKSLRVEGEKARALRRRALSALVLGLMIKVYWGGYGPWSVLDNPTLAHVRSIAEPLLIYGGAILYLVGWVLKWI